MPGRQDFTTPGTSESGTSRTLAVNERPELTKIVRNLDPVSAGSKVTEEIYAPTGSTYKVQSLYLVANRVDNDGGSTGTHQFKVRPMNSFATHIGTNTYDNFLVYKSGWQGVDTSKRVTPTDSAAAVAAQQGLRATENAALAIMYRNQTDVSQSRVEVKIIVEEVSY